MLNQLSSDERSNTGVLKNIVQRVVKIFCSGLTDGQCYTAQERLCAGIMIVVVRAHGIDVVLDSGGLRRGKVPACEDAGEGIDDRLIVGRDGLTGRIAD